MLSYRHDVEIADDWWLEPVLRFGASTTLRPLFVNLVLMPSFSSQMLLVGLRDCGVTAGLATLAALAVRTSRYERLIFGAGYVAFGVAQRLIGTRQLSGLSLYLCWAIAFSVISVAFGYVITLSFRRVRANWRPSSYY